MSNHPLRALFLENTMSRVKNCTTLRVIGKFMNRNKVSAKFRNMKDIFKSDVII
ncbi:uncharacterized protein G2W53_015377 [Senna tora]|uniref:Uncharacterized protein n=1 Tax=Senna tora TaxID=362788 RepID=A0A834WVH5_9FABA|nr:uncharacterized protein G2W53_015377 [Senna tora]